MSLTQINKAGLHEIALDHVFTIGASGSSAYTFQGEGLNGTVNNPTLYLTRGKTYRFENGSGGHPIRIQSTSGASGTAYNTGVTNNAGSGTVIVEVQHDAPDVLYYQCTSHAAMNGILYITGALADGGVTTAKIAADAVTGAKIADDAINSEHYTDGSIDTAHIADSQVTTAKIANNAINSDKIATNAVNTTEIADTAVTLAKLEHGTSSNDGKFLRANNGADPTFEAIPPAAITAVGNTGANRVITDDGDGTVTAEANLTFDGSVLTNAGSTVIGNDIKSGTDDPFIYSYKGGSDGQVRSGLQLDGTNQRMEFYTGTNERMRIDAGGGLQLGTSTATASKLTIYGSDAASIFQGSNTGTGAGNGFITGNNGDVNAFVWNYENGFMQFATNNTERMRIDSSGKVLIGTTTPAPYSTRLLTVGDTSFDDTALEIRSSSSTGRLYFTDSDSAGVGAYMGAIQYHHTDDSMKFETGGGTLRLRIDSDGLKFGSDTAAANALNDYEEGEATITVFANNNVSISSSYNKMDYTKIGNLVTITGLIQISGVHSGDYFRINLPFTSVNHGNPRRSDAVGAVMHNNVNTGDCGLVAYLSMGSSILNFYKVNDNSSWSILTNSDLASSDEMYFTITYKTA